MPFLCCSSRRAPAPAIDDYVSREEHEGALTRQGRRQCGLFAAICFVFVAAQQFMQKPAVAPSDNELLNRCWRRNEHLLADCEHESRLSALAAGEPSFARATALKCEMSLKKSLAAYQEATRALQAAYKRGYQDHSDRRPPTNFPASRLPK